MKKVRLAIIVLTLLALLGTQAAWAAPTAKKWCKHVVRRGETLSGIAYKYGTTTKALVRANKIPNRRLIYPRQVLWVPCTPQPEPKPCKAWYEVQRGDTLWGIGSWYGVTPKCIAEKNDIPNKRLIYPGQWLCIPKTCK